MFAIFETGIGILKVVNLSYSTSQLTQFVFVLISLCILESIRIYLGRKGSLSDYGWQVILSVFLTIPCIMGVVFLVFYQAYKLRLEYILCAIQLLLQVSEVVFAIIFVFTICREETYD